jgi:hypothetical protein
MAQVDAFNPDGSMSRGVALAQSSPAKWKSFKILSCDQFLAVHQIYRVSQGAAIVNGVVDAGTVVKTHSIKRQWLIESAEWLVSPAR